MINQYRFKSVIGIDYLPSKDMKYFLKTFDVRLSFVLIKNQHNIISKNKYI